MRYIDDYKNYKQFKFEILAKPLGFIFNYALLGFIFYKAMGYGVSILIISLLCAALFIIDDLIKIMNRNVEYEMKNTSKIWNAILEIRYALMVFIVLPLAVLKFFADSEYNIILDSIVTWLSSAII